MLTLCHLVALVGSDVVTTLRSDPTVEVDPWWMPKSWPKTLRLSPLPQTCQPVSITEDTPLRTNSPVSLFKYVLRHASQNGTGFNPSERIYPAPYMGNSLKGCEVTTITLNMQLPVVLFTYTFAVQCSLGGKKDYSFRVPDNFTFSMTYRRAENGDMGPDDMINYLAFNTVPVAGQIFQASPTLEALPSNATSPNNVVGVLDAMQSDLNKAIWAQKGIYTQFNETYHTMNVVEWAAGSTCTSGNGSRALDTPCNGITDPNRLIRWYETTDGVAMDANFMWGFNTTLSNVFISLRDAVMLDLGNADTSANIYLDKSYFNSAIRTDPFFVTALPTLKQMLMGEEPITDAIFWNSCTWGWGCINTTSWADGLRNAPDGDGVNNLVLPWKPGPEFSNWSSVLSFSYLCPTLQKKSTGSLLTAVFVATATMLGVLYSIFEVAMPKIERRYLRRQAARGRLINPNEDERLEAIALMDKTRSRQPSETTYYQSSMSEIPDKYGGYEYPYSKEYSPVITKSYSYSTHNEHGHQT
ncbi:bet1-like protein [Ceratobasidium sp. AG-Ba]|nr:bet1-like protein [Ceratobasidium sp. AG-Ba]